MLPKRALPQRSNATKMSHAVLWAVAVWLHAVDLCLREVGSRDDARCLNCCNLVNHVTPTDYAKDK